jgi:hypothetical protein
LHLFLIVPTLAINSCQTLSDIFRNPWLIGGANFINNTFYEFSNKKCVKTPITRQLAKLALD